MMNKSKIKFIRSLQTKKHRQLENLFVAEGTKLVDELLASANAVTLVATRSWLDGNPQARAGDIFCVSEEELSRISFLQHPQQVLGVFQQMEPASVVPADGLSLALDGIQDPGNLGTILRIADWFGIGTVFCSEDTVDVYNPKVVQATMGSIARVKVAYGNLETLLAALPPTFPVYGTVLDGENIYEQSLQPQGLIVMGNEGKGISPAVKARITHRLFIPSYAANTAESLNVAIATAVTCAEFRRRNG